MKFSLHPIRMSFFAKNLDRKMEAARAKTCSLKKVQAFKEFFFPLNVISNRLTAGCGEDSWTETVPPLTATTQNILASPHASKATTHQLPVLGKKFIQMRHRGGDGCV